MSDDCNQRGENRLGIDEAVGDGTDLGIMGNVLSISAFSHLNLNSFSNDLFILDCGYRILYSSHIQSKTKLAAVHLHSAELCSDCATFS